eukprot:2434147-Prorocentrum_lima.AAC.1
MTSSLVGSEMCIRDSHLPPRFRQVDRLAALQLSGPIGEGLAKSSARTPVSYTHLTLPTICSV